MFIYLALGHIHKLSTMKRVFLKIASAFICLLLFGTWTVKSQTVHLEALDAYWKIAAHLKQGDTLSRQEWKQFLDLDGNKQYIQSKGFDERFIENYRLAMQIAYMPQNLEKVQRMLERKFDHWLVYRVHQYKVHEQELKSYAMRLKTPAYLDSVYKNAWNWLPERLHFKKPVDIYFIGIDNDVSVQKGAVVFTAWSAYVQDHLKYGSKVGHEMHHILRGAFSTAKVNPADEGLLYALNAMLNEGTADMIDKKYLLDHLQELPDEYQSDCFLLSGSAQIIGQIDSCIQVMAESGAEKFNTVEQYQKLLKYSNGHNPGYFMTEVITRNGFKEELLENIQNPFYFLRLYDKAAKKDKQHPVQFSELSMNYCLALEARLNLHQPQR